MNHISNEKGRYVMHMKVTMHMVYIHILYMYLECERLLQRVFCETAAGYTLTKEYDHGAQDSCFHFILKLRGVTNKVVGIRVIEINMYIILLTT